jgi:hypothetical protein
VGLLLPALALRLSLLLCLILFVVFVIDRLIIALGCVTPGSPKVLLFPIMLKLRRCHHLVSRRGSLGQTLRKLHG